MTVKLWRVDRLIYVLIIILNPIHSLFFQLFVQNVVYFFIFLFVKLTHIEVLKIDCMKLE